VLPDETSILFSPLINRATGPDGINLALAPNNIPTNKKMISKKTTTLAKIIV
jgi:hypothetical protein